MGVQKAMEAPNSHVVFLSTLRVDFGLFLHGLYLTSSVQLYQLVLSGCWEHGFKVRFSWWIPSIATYQPCDLICQVKIIVHTS